MIKEGEDTLDNKTQYWYTRKDVLAALKAKGLPSTWSQIDNYWKVGFIPAFRNIVLFHRKDSPTTKGNRRGIIISKRDMPIFTREEISTLVSAVAKIKADEEATRQAKLEESSL